MAARPGGSCRPTEYRSARTYRSHAIAARPGDRPVHGTIHSGAVVTPCDVLGQHLLRQHAELGPERTLRQPRAIPYAFELRPLSRTKVEHAGAPVLHSHRRWGEALAIKRQHGEHAPVSSLSGLKARHWLVPRLWGGCGRSRPGSTSFESQGSFCHRHCRRHPRNVF